MNKKIFGFILAIGLMGGAVACAQNNSQGNDGKNKTEMQKGNKPGKKGDSKRMGGADLAFKDLQLTADQQQRLQVLREGLGPVVAIDGKKLSKEEMKKLTPEQKQQMKNERKAKKLEAKKKYLNGVKEILTPDQYVVFLENVYVYSLNKMGDSHKEKNKDHKGIKKGERKGKKDNNRQKKS